MVVFGCFGLAWDYAEGEHKRISFLSDWRDILDSMEEEVRYGKISLPECFLHIGMRFDTALGECIGRVGKELEGHPGKGVRKELNQEIQEEFGKLFRREELSELFQFTSMLGFQKEEMQKRALERQREMVEELLCRKKEAYREKRRIILFMGAFLGVFLVLLLI